MNLWHQYSIQFDFEIILWSCNFRMKSFVVCIPSRCVLVRKSKHEITKTFLFRKYHIRHLKWVQYVLQPAEEWRNHLVQNFEAWHHKPRWRWDRMSPLAKWNRWISFPLLGNLLGASAIRLLMVAPVPKCHLLHHLHFQKDPNWFFGKVKNKVGGAQNDDWDGLSLGSTFPIITSCFAVFAMILFVFLSKKSHCSDAASSISEIPITGLLASLLFCPLTASIMTFTVDESGNGANLLLALFRPFHGFDTIDLAMKKSGDVDEVRRGWSFPPSPTATRFPLHVTGMNPLTNLPNLPNLVALQVLLRMHPRNL